MMNTDGPTASLPAAVAVLQEKLAVSDNVGDPQAYLRDLHKAWKTAGGALGGKPRHSDRFLADQLKASGVAVRSLTPKLAGNTRIKPRDADILVRHFLSHWPGSPAAAKGSAQAHEITYAPLLAEEEIDELAEFVADELESPAPAGVKVQSDALLPGEDVATLLRRLYEESDAFFTVGTERALLPLSPPVALRGFRDLINAFRTIEESDGKPRPLVWVLDLGRQTFDDPESARRYMSVQDLIMRIKALALFDDHGREERLKWLDSRAVFVVLDTRYEQHIEIKGFRRPSIIAHHVSFSAIPSEWAKSSRFRALYGSELERLHHRTFSVFLNAKGGWQSADDHDDNELRFRRYFGLATFTADASQNAPQIGRGLELPSPGASYEEAYKTVYAAATTLLGLKNQANELQPVDGDQAVAQLNYLGFRLLRLQEFTRL